MVEMISEIPEDVAGGHVTTRLTTQEDGRYLRQYCNDNRRHRMKDRGDSRYYTLSDLVARRLWMPTIGTPRPYVQMSDYIWDVELRLLHWPSWPLIGPRNIFLV